MGQTQYYAKNPHCPLIINVWYFGNSHRLFPVMSYYDLRLLLNWNLHFIVRGYVVLTLCCRILSTYKFLIITFCIFCSMLFKFVVLICLCFSVPHLLATDEMYPLFHHEIYQCTLTCFHELLLLLTLHDVMYGNDNCTICCRRFQSFQENHVLCAIMNFISNVDVISRRHTAFGKKLIGSVKLARQKFSLLTHWGRVTDIYVGKLTIIGLNNGLSPGRHQAVIWTNDVILLIIPLGTNFSEILIGNQIFSFKKMYLKMSSVKWRPLCLGLNVLTK